MITITDDVEYREFQKWKQEKEDRAALEERSERRKRDAQQRRDDFILQQKIDGVIRQAIERGQTWDQFVRAEEAPGDLKGRFLELQEQAQQEERAQRQDDLFMKGFQAGY